MRRRTRDEEELACDDRSHLPSPTLGAGKTCTERVPACSTRTPRREHIGDTDSRPASGTRRGTGDSRLPSRSGSGTQPRCAGSRVGPWVRTPSMTRELNMCARFLAIVSNVRVSTKPGQLQKTVSQCELDNRSLKRNTVISLTLM